MKDNLDDKSERALKKFFLETVTGDWDVARLKRGDNSLSLLLGYKEGDPPSDDIPAADIDDQLSDKAAWARWLYMTEFGPVPQLFEGAIEDVSLSQYYLDQFNPEKFPIRSVARSLITPSKLPDRMNGRLTQVSPLWETLINIDIVSRGSPLINKAAYATSKFLVTSPVESDTSVHHLTYWWDKLRTILQTPGATITDIVVEATLSVVMASFLTFLGKTKFDPETGQAPDENYAREVMQLFTLGVEMLNLDGTPQIDDDGNAIPTYSQEDIANLAKLLTGAANPNMFAEAYEQQHPNTVNPAHHSQIAGWNAANAPMDAGKHLHFYPDRHYWGEVRFLDVVIPAVDDRELQTTEMAIERLRQAITELCKHQNLTTFWAVRWIKFLVTENPTPKYVKDVAAVGELGKFRLPNGEVIGSGKRGDVKAMLAAIFFHEEANQPDTDNPMAGRVLSYFEIMMAMHLWFSGKSERYPPSLNPDTLRDFLQEGEYIHFASRDLAARGLFTEGSVFGHGRPLKPITDIDGNRFQSPSLQNHDPGAVIELLDKHAWTAPGGMTFHDSWVNNREIVGGWAEQNRQARENPEAYVEMLAEAFGGVHDIDELAWIKTEARNRVDSIGGPYGSFTDYGETASGGPQAGALGIYFMLAMSANHLVRI